MLQCESSSQGGSITMGNVTKQKLFADALEEISHMGEVILSHDGKGHYGVVIKASGSIPEFHGEGGTYEAAAQMALDKKNEFLGNGGKDTCGE